VAGSPLKTPGFLGLRLSADLPHAVQEVDDLADKNSVVQGQPGYCNEDVHVGDLVLEIDGCDVTGLSIAELHELLRGEIHTLVHITLKRRRGEAVYAVEVLRHRFHEFDRPNTSSPMQIRRSIDTDADAVSSHRERKRSESEREREGRREEEDRYKEQLQMTRLVRDASAEQASDPRDGADNRHRTLGLDSAHLGAHDGCTMSPPSIGTSPPTVHANAVGSSANGSESVRVLFEQLKGLENRLEGLGGHSQQSPLAHHEDGKISERRHASLSDNAYGALQACHRAQQVLQELVANVGKLPAKRQSLRVAGSHTRTTVLPAFLVYSACNWE